MIKAIRYRLPAACLLAGLLFFAVLPVPKAMAEPTEIEIVDRTVGDGLSPRRGWFVIVRYTGWIYDEKAPDKKGRQFIHSDDRGAPVSFVYGYKRALPGMEKGMEGMKVGGKRVIKIPAKMNQSHPQLAGTRPQQVPVTVEVELLAVRNLAPPRNAPTAAPAIK